MAPDWIAPLLPHAMVWVAHQDDEAAAFGALLQRMHDPLVVFATDGAPRDRYFWSRYGSREEYARVRRQEALRAASAVGVTKFESFDIADQELHMNLPQALQQLENLVEGYKPSALITLAYEGGHPDHDCCAFLSRVLHKRRGYEVWEAPLYHRINGAVTVQEFLSLDSSVTVPAQHRLHVSSEEAARKRVMFATYESQGIVLSQFDLEKEIFRKQAGYDFLRPPHQGELNYEAWKWPMKGGDLCSEFRSLQDRS